MDSNSKEMLTLSKLKIKVDATRSMLNRHLSGCAFLPEIWSDSDEASGDEASCEEKKEKMKRMIEGMDCGDLEKLDDFTNEINAQMNAIKAGVSSIEHEQLEPKLEEISKLGDTPLVGSAVCLQVQASEEESVDDNSTYELETARLAQEGEGGEFVDLSKECLEGVRQNESMTQGIAQAATLKERVLGEAETLNSMKEVHPMQSGLLYKLRKH